MEKVKLIAFHLPQYHRFPENDAWWGEGFTEWTNVKKAKALFEGHNQPRVPLHSHYYDLTNAEDLKHQMELAENYGIDGFCYYHYWFDGKLLLHKPLELMRTFDKKLPYFFCWANEPWTKAWDGLNSEILMPQRYGGEEEWEQHFQYLLTFFKDPYYMCKDNMPIFVIYRTNNITDCDAMIAYWNQKCKENGFDGIYVVEEVNSFQKEPSTTNSKAYLEFEPMYTSSHMRSLADRIKDKVQRAKFDEKTNTEIGIFDYQEIWKNILTRKRVIKDKQVFLGGFVDWDNTARKGTKGMVFLNCGPDKFEKYMREQMEKAKEIGSEFVFINAWNEWGEGTYLEPDEKYQYGYLEAISRIVKDR